MLFPRARAADCKRSGEPFAETGGIGAPLLGGYLADTFNPGVPFLAYAPLLVLSAFLLALVAHETLEK